MIKLSIITVCWNSVKTIERCLKSIVPFINDEIEYIVIDGKSTDGTVEILKKYEQEYKIRIISEKDTGIYNAMNKGAKISNGKYIWYINSDDEAYSESIYEVLELINKQNTEVDCLYGDMSYVREINGNRYEEIKKANANIDKIKENMSIWHPCFICKRDVFLKLNGFDEKFKIASDWDLILRIYLKNYSFKYINIIMVRFTSGGASFKPPIIEKHKIRVKNNVIGFIDYYMIKNYINYLLQYIYKLLFKSILQGKQMERSKLIT